jgi:Fe-S cluster biogenesis protein NfuA
MSFMINEIIVWLLVAVVAFFSGRVAWRGMRKPDSGCASENGCSSCPMATSGLKQLEKKQTD